MKSTIERAGIVAQEATRAKSFHPTGRFIEFSEKDAEQSIPERFEKMVGAPRGRVTH